MAMIEIIEKQLEDAKKLKDLEEKLFNEEYRNEKQEKRWEDKINELKKEKEGLKKDKVKWENQVINLQNKLVDFRKEEIITKSGIKRKTDEDIKFNTKEQNSGSIYLNHRLANTSGNPITLQHLIFRTFLEDCETITPNDINYAFVLDVTESMSNVFTNKDERRDAFKILFRKHYEVSLNQYINAKITTDGSSFEKKGIYMTSTMEVKSELR
ncbi:10984_t:CDS:2 [Funneliformis caledonium]|uniref:10984_t:CDS:1 n=1 Tax=Funneliformis caledonium TaxID=1117310 RepID=A0A9N9GR91_9GLOM|nr:10984_t:CDS:2 [Funneliformis caledonium]